MKRMALSISTRILILANADFAAEEHQAVPFKTRAEAQARANNLFDKRDLDHDGKLDQAHTSHDGILASGEYRAFALAIRQQMRGDWQKHTGPDGDMRSATSIN